MLLNFVALRQKVSVRDIRCGKNLLLGKVCPKFTLGLQICHQSIGCTRVSIDTLYSRPNFGCRLLRFRDIAGFVSQMPLLYITPRLLSKIWRCSPRVRSTRSVRQWDRSLGQLVVMLFSENINLFNHCRAHDRNRQAGLLWQHRAMHYSASRGKNSETTLWVDGWYW